MVNKQGEIEVRHAKTDAAGQARFTDLPTGEKTGYAAVIEWRGWKRWAFPLIVAGLNPITLYCMWQLMGGFVRDSMKTHLGQHIFENLGTLYTPIFERVSTLLVFWLILLWMYRRRIFLRI